LAQVLKRAKKQRSIHFVYPVVPSISMKKILYTSLLLLALSLQTSAQSFYDPNVLQEVKITFYQSNWDFLLDSLKNLDNGVYLLAPSVVINGVVFDSVGVKYKGNSSYSPNNAKNPLHIELNFVRPDQNYLGVKDVKLSNGFADPTFIREPLSFEILRQYTDAPLANHAKLWINGAYWGLYGNVESINKSFIRSHIKTDGNNPFFKCNPEDFGGPGTGGNYPDLVYSSADSSFYYNKYDKQSTDGWQQLLMLMDTLKNNPSAIHNILDVDRALWMLAFNTLLVNLDSYTGAFGQNYYLYYDRNKRWVCYNWDLNMSFGGFPLLVTAGGGLSITQMKQLDPLTQSTNNNRPLIKQLLADPIYKRMYIAHMRTMLKEHFLDDAYKTRALEMQAVIDAAVQADTKKFFTYTSFLNNVNQSVPGGFGNVPGITDLMSARRTFLNTNSNFTAPPPSISNVNALLGSVVQVRATVQNASTVLLGWRADTADVFKRIPMFDDGQHADGAPGDGVYGANFPQDDPSMQYYIYAENAAAGIFSPERAEHEFYLADPLIPDNGDVVINEFLASNTTGEVDEAGEREDWLELFNNTNAPITLTGFYITDNPNSRKKWAFPAGVSIPGNGFLIVWLDNDALQGPFHANFKLSGAAGEHLMLSDGGNNILDSLSFGVQQPNISYGRYPNGTGNFTSMNTTFDTFNSMSISTGEPGLNNAVQVFPNPVSDVFTIRGTTPLGQIRVLNALGQTLAIVVAGEQNEVTLATQKWPNGLYTLQMDNQTARIRVQH